jgi:hypothetical protein
MTTRITNPSSNVIKSNTIYQKVRPVKKRYTVGVPYEYPWSVTVSPEYVSITPDADTDIVSTNIPVRRL